MCWLQESSTRFHAACLDLVKLCALARKEDTDLPCLGTHGYLDVILSRVSATYQ